MMTNVRLSPARSQEAGQGSVALLIDWENMKGTAEAIGGPPDIITIKKIARRYGTLDVARAYANWADPWHEGDMERLAQQGIEPVFALTRARTEEQAIRNSADVQLACDGMELLASCVELSCFVIASGDGSLAHLVRHLRSHGKRVVRLAGKKSVTKLMYVPGEEQVIYDEWVEGLKSARSAPRIVTALDKLVQAVAVLDGAGGPRNLKAVKDEMRCQDAAFEEETLGLPSFRHLAYLAEDKGMIAIDADRKEPADAYPLNKLSEKTWLYPGAVWSRFIRAVRQIELKEAQWKSAKGERTGSSKRALCDVIKGQKDPPRHAEEFFDCAVRSQILWHRSSTQYYSPAEEMAKKGLIYLLNLHHPRVQVALLKGPISPKPSTPRQ